MTPPYLGEDLILVLSPPRSGSTMLQRMLGTHSQVQTHPEPHVLTPLAFQGVFHQIERAAFNHRVAAGALREFVESLPRGEEDYLDACRAYCAVLYGRARAVSGKRYFVDKTPNYADTILPFIVRLLPKARYIVLTRHPVAQIASHANTFVGGDFQRSQFQRDIPGTFIPPLARLLRERPVPLVHVRYEDLVSDPEAVVRRLLEQLGLDFEPACLRYGDAEHVTKTYGDPNIARHKAPVANSLHRWVDDLVDRPDRERVCREALAHIAQEDLATLGYPAETLWQPLLKARRERGGLAATPAAVRWHDQRWRAVALLGRTLARPSWRRRLLRLRDRLDALVSYSARWHGGGAS